MAVQNKYIHADLVAATKQTTAAFRAQGTQIIKMIATFEVAAADDDGSIYRVFPNIPASYVPVSLRLACDALTGSTSWDVGLYKPNLGDVVADNILGSAIDLAAGYSRILAKDGLVSVDLADCQKSLWELASQTITTKATVFDIALTADTVGSGAGTVTVTAEFFNP